eukprot:m.59036 g.59036  ORF g.59036 m.59036 type:complete len:322 (-) comp9439_c0_seq1:546-1511(-)
MGPAVRRTSPAVRGLVVRWRHHRCRRWWRGRWRSWCAGWGQGYNQLTRDPRGHVWRDHSQRDLRVGPVERNLAVVGWSVVDEGPTDTPLSRDAHSLGVDLVVAPRHVEVFHRALVVRHSLVDEREDAGVGHVSVVLGVAGWDIGRAVVVVELDGARKPIRVEPRRGQLVDGRRGTVRAARRDLLSRKLSPVLVAAHKDNGAGVAVVDAFLGHPEQLGSLLRYLSPLLVLGPPLAHLGHLGDRGVKGSARTIVGTVRTLTHSALVGKGWEHLDPRPDDFDLGRRVELGLQPRPLGVPQHGCLGAHRCQRTKRSASGGSESPA